jgi:hypothetical protein
VLGHEGVERLLLALERLLPIPGGTRWRTTTVASW